MIIRSLLSVALVLISFGAIADITMCPLPAPLGAGSDDLRFKEADFTLKAYGESLDNLRLDLPKQLRSLPPGKDVNSIEGFWISYFNSLTIIEGFTLKSAALLERAHHPGVRGGADERHFCTWLKKQEYID